MKVQITLVGGQPMPVYLGIMELPSDKVILVHSKESVKTAENISAEFADKCDMRCFPSVDMAEIREQAKMLLEEFADAEVSINVTSGTKPWSLAFALLSQGKNNVQLYYVDQNCEFYNYTTGEKWLSAQTLDMQKLMAFNGKTAKTHKLLADYTEEDMKTLREVKKLRNEQPIGFNKLTIPTKAWKKKLNGSNEGDHTLEDGESFVEWNKKEGWVHIYIHGKRFDSENDFQSPNAFDIVFNSGWFEYEVAQMMSRWSKAKEVWLNVVFPYKEGQPKNEIDVVVNTGVKLLMIECKTQINDQTDIDKFNTAIKNYGGMGCKGLFITDSKMKPQAIEKCEDSHLFHFSMKDYQKKTAAAGALFEILDRELLNTNAR